MKTQVITLVAVILFSLNVSAKTTAVSTPDEIPSSELLKTQTLIHPLILATLYIIVALPYQVWHFIIIHFID